MRVSVEDRDRGGKINPITMSVNHTVRLVMKSVVISVGWQYSKERPHNTFSQESAQSDRPVKLNDDSYTQ